MLTGIYDSSGVRLYYTDQAPEQTAGILPLGHSVIGHMIIPPRVERYTVIGYCSQRCTNAVSMSIGSVTVATYVNTYGIHMNVHNNNVYSYVC